MSMLVFGGVIPIAMPDSVAALACKHMFLSVEIADRKNLQGPQSTCAAS